MLIAATALALAVSAIAVGPTPIPIAYAGGNCTAWGSKIDPPPTIRVGRLDGRVDTVDFRQYVGIVMAKEWAAKYPAATLEAAAVAVKQYGWYYTLAGHWRTSYANASGECFDVKDSTADQLYRPEMIETVDPRFWRAIDATWGLTVRKNGRFFLTGYRSGTLTECAADANGWKLFAKSIAACGRDGWTREQIQTVYYAPDVTFHWSDAAGADFDPLWTPIDAPTVDILTGKRLGDAHTRVSWDPQALRPAGTTYQLQRLVSGSWKSVALADPTQSSINLLLKPGTTQRFRVRLRDGDGDVGVWYTGPRFVPRLLQSSSSAFSWSKAGWLSHRTSYASGGVTRYSTRDGSTSTFTFTGRAVAIVGVLGPKRGKARIFVDDVLEEELDLYAARNRWRTLIFTREWTGSATHTVRVEVVGSKRVDVDAALYYP